LKKIDNELKNIPESQQRYLDAIYLISKTKKAGWVSNKNIKNFLKVQPSSVTNMLRQLNEAGYISWAPRKGIRLTKIGKDVAIRLEQIDSLLREFFSTILKIQDEELVNSLSCDIEHHIFSQKEEVYQNLKNFMERGSEILKCIDKIESSE
jgi:Mn-dependent DtxR family transcriptional regulator